ncbi:MAG TPA: DegV family protein [Anaerolineales bacterium]|nr:DegV family protein [Anaerolineales bacterium]
MRIAIVTDSTADIPYDLADQLQIHVVPNILMIDGKSIEDGRDFSRQEFYTRLPEMTTLPTTGAASIGTYLHMYESLFQQGYEYILSIHASSLLSGIFNSASAAAQSFGERVRVVDSKQVTLALGFQVLAAVEAVAVGLALEKVIQRVLEMQPWVRMVAMIDTLEYLKRSGRVSWAIAGLGSLLKIKQFVEVKDGVVHRIGESRTRSKGIARLVEILHSQGSLERLAILHTNAENDARQILENLTVKLSMEPLVVNVTTVLGTHVGPNGLGFAAVLERPAV